MKKWRKKKLSTKQFFFFKNQLTLVQRIRFNIAEMEDMNMKDPHSEVLQIKGQARPTWYKKKKRRCFELGMYLFWALIGRNLLKCCIVKFWYMMHLIRIVAINTLVCFQIFQIHIQWICQDRLRTKPTSWFTSVVCLYMLYIPAWK